MLSTAELGRKLHEKSIMIDSVLKMKYGLNWWVLIKHL